MDKKVVGVHVHVWTALNWLRMGPNGGFYEHCSDASGFKKDELRNYKTFKKFCGLPQLAICLYVVAIQTHLSRSIIFKVKTDFLYW